MSEVYTNVCAWGSKILYRGRKNGRPQFNRFTFSPTLYLKGKPDTSESGAKSLYGENIEPISFDNIKEAREFIDKMRGVDGFTIFGNSDYAQQFIYQNCSDKVGGISDVKVVTIDIETTSLNGFPTPLNPVETVLLITIKDFNTKKTITFGLGEIDFDSDDYIKCTTEADLLSRFIRHFSEDYPDILTGWNSNLFDVPYLISRMNRVIGESETKKLSPWGVIKFREKEFNGKIFHAYEILGVSCIDYLDLYKKFVLKPRESYKLDSIAFVELGENKLENPYDTFKEFYENDWSRFVKYNIHDVHLVDMLEDKLRLIDLLVAITYYAKCNYNDVFSPVKTWDCILSNAMADANIFAPLKERAESFGTIEGAYVHEPVPGMYKWIVSFDATSLYPSIIMQYNISPETLLPGQLDCTVDGMLNHAYEFDDTNVSVLTNGARFDNTKRGFFPIVVQEMFDDRQKFKKMMLAKKRELELTTNETERKAIENQIADLDNKQHSRKILLNSLYGATANEGFRFYERKISEGITTTGQFIIRYVGQRVNQYMNKLMSTEGVEYAFYMDTDSCYITLGLVVDKFFKDKPVESIVTILDKFCNDKLGVAIDKACYDLKVYTNAFDQKVFFKREAIASNGFWTKKKRYAMNVYDNEGVRYTEPEMKVMGLEIVRSSTPEAVRDMLRESVRIVLQGTQEDVQKYTKDCKTKFYSLPPEAIAFPRSINGLQKYAFVGGRFAKGTPAQVKGALVYNKTLKDKGVQGKYPEIGEGDKAKFIYLKSPNPIESPVIAFITSTIPSEFGLTGFFDYDTMWDTSFAAPLDKILSAIGWSAQETAQLSGFIYD